MSFTEDSKGRIWIGSFLSGLYSYDIKLDILKHYKSKAFKSLYIDSKNIRKVVADHLDNIWIGTRTGLYKIEKPDSEAPKISTYAYGMDYHYVIKNKLNQLLEFIKEEIGDVHGRAFVDSAPILEKAWAKKSGLGWIGKHSNMLTQKVGSFYFIAELIIDLELEPDHAVTDHCGSCTACIDACPTDAITEPYKVDGSKCISYFTIELKENIPTEMGGKLDNWMFGCDVCQDVCPWNRFSKQHNEPLFNPKPELLSMTKKDWEEITQETFNKVFKNSAVKRTKYSGLTRNIRFLNQ